MLLFFLLFVSTHSRPKAAGTYLLQRQCVLQFQHTAARRRLGHAFHLLAESVSFNTQPPEGGWICQACTSKERQCFNTQPPEGGWRRIKAIHFRFDVSTHSRPKAAGCPPAVRPPRTHCFNTQPPEGGWIYFVGRYLIVESFQHTAARRRLAQASGQFGKGFEESFQHTAARRRLANRRLSDNRRRRFNTQPPEGGWQIDDCLITAVAVSTHSRPKAAGCVHA